jgi:hypothetical protein
MMFPVLAALLLGRAQPDAAVDFDTEVIPLLTRYGCNAGSCHGAAAGQGGLHLSLWGSVPDEDYDAIVRTLEGRRVNLAHPELSLLLVKPAGGLDHGGGDRFEPESPPYRVLYQWIVSGAPRLRARRLQALEISGQAEPYAHEARIRITDRRSEALELLVAPGNSVQLHVEALFDDGVQRDVTPWAVLSALDPAAVYVEEGGSLRPREPGLHVVLVRYLHMTAAVRLLAPLHGTVVSGVRGEAADVAATDSGQIDAEIDGTLQLLGFEPARAATDEAFLRRVSLDLTGRLPTPQQRAAFLADARPDRRQRLIDALLESESYVDYWTLFWGRVVRLDSATMGPQGARALQQWLRTQVAQNVPLDVLAHALLHSEGDTHIVGPANFYRVAAGPRELAEYFAEAMAGIRLACANCHNHPFDRWTQDDYHGLAALFAPMERGRVVRFSGRGEVTHPRTGMPARPRVPGGPDVLAGSDPRHSLAEWLTSQDGLWLARAAVNRLWQAMFGRGLVEPVDDLRPTNPASHPRLLDRLSEEFAASGYDVKKLLRLLASSNAYGRDCRADASPLEARLYACRVPRPLPAEVLLDALADVTGVPERWPDATTHRAVTVVDPRVPSTTLAALGRCAGSTVCGGSASSVGLAQSLHLLNGAAVNARLANPSGWLARCMAEGRDDVQIIDELYVRALTRLPAPAEREVWLQALAEGDRRQVLEDLAWCLLCSEEFMMNH